MFGRKNGGIALDILASLGYFLTCNIILKYHTLSIIKKSPEIFRWTVLKFFLSPTS